MNKVPKRYENAKWEDVPITIQQVFETVCKGEKGIYLHGAVGTGKTHICWAIKNHYDQPNKDTPTGYRVGRSLTLWNVVDLMHEIRSDFDRGPYDKHRPEGELCNPENHQLIILDDIGFEKTTEFVAETLYRIINHRYIHQLPTIFTSNCTIQDLADKIGERSASRIVEMSNIITLTGKDRRMS